MNRAAVMKNKQMAISLAVLVMVVMHVVGYGLIVANAINQLDLRTVANGEKLSNRITDLVDSVVVSFDERLLSTVTHCSEFLPNAQALVLSNPYVRSVTLSNKHSIYCSTVTGERVIPLSRDYQDTKPLALFYIPQSPVIKSSDVVIVRLFFEPLKSYISFGIDTPHFYDLLTSELDYIHPEMVIDNYLFVQGKKPTKIETLPAHKRAIANAYVKIYFNVSNADYRSYIVSNYLYTFVLLSFAAMFIAIVVYRFTKRYDWQTLLIARGISQRQFKPYLQPIFTRDEQLAGFEVLARWIHPKKGMIPPDVFIHSAEKSGQINQIFTLLTDEVIAQLSPYKNRFPERFHISFNVSAPQLIQPLLIKDCRRLLDSLAGSQLNNQVCQATLVLELTERVEIPQEPIYLDTIARLKSLGILIALDDFGTGHSSLRYLKNIDIDYLKIDKSFVDMILEGSLEHHILDNVLDLARRIGVPSIAEGVESESQVAYLMQHNVDYFQGYFYGRPMPAEEFIERYFSI
jgi:EAL domain-containing protein (putative c-di-GMP-specific phosphodiesterase class I)